MKSFFICQDRFHQLSPEQLKKRTQLNYFALGAIGAMLLVTGIDSYVRLGELSDTFFALLPTLIPSLAELESINKLQNKRDQS